MQQNNLRTLSGARKISYPRSISRFTAFENVEEPGQCAGLPQAQNIWILNSVLDPLFVCGGLLLILFIAALLNPVLMDNQTGLGFLLFAAAIIYSDSHNASTLMRLATEPALAEKHSVITKWLPLFLLLFIPFAISNVVLLSYAVKLYLIWITQHVSAQAYGITLIYLRKTKIVLERDDILALKGAFTAMMIAGMVRQLSSSAALETLGIAVPQILILPDWIILWSAIAAVTASLIALITLIQSAYRCSVFLHPGAVMVLTASLAIFTLGGLMGTMALYAPAFFHASQYLAVTIARAIEMRDQQKRLQLHSVTQQLFTESTFQYCLCILCIGILLYLIIPMAISKFGFPAANCLAAVFCAVNFHHFIADALIWRRGKVSFQ